MFGIYHRMQALFARGLALPGGGACPSKSLSQQMFVPVEAGLAGTGTLREPVPEWAVPLH